MVARSTSGMPVDEPVTMPDRPVVTPAWNQWLQRLHQLASAGGSVTPADVAALEANLAAVSASLAALDATVLHLTGGTLSGGLTIDMTNAALVLDKAPGTNLATMVSASGGSFRWSVTAANGEAETGGNTGSNFSIDRYDDAGTFIGTPFYINRTNGQVLVNGVDLAGKIAIIEARLTAAGIP